MSEGIQNFKTAPRITITSVCKWNDETCTWTAKTKDELSEALQACVAAANGAAPTFTIKNNPPTSDQLKPYKKLPLSKKSDNDSIARYFEKGGEPSLGTLHRAQKGAKTLNEVLKTFYWMSARELRSLVASYNKQLKAAMVEDYHLLKVLHLHKPKKLSVSEIANYLVSKGANAGEYDMYADQIKKVEDAIESRRK